jgi:hypothetical protein
MAMARPRRSGFSGTTGHHPPRSQLWESPTPLPTAPCSLTSVPARRRHDGRGHNVRRLPATSSVGSEPYYAAHRAAGSAPGGRKRAGQQVLDEFGGGVLLMIEADLVATAAQPVGTVGPRSMPRCGERALTKGAIITSFSAGELAAQQPLGWNVARGGIQLDYVPPSASGETFEIHGSLCPAARTTYTISATSSTSTTPRTSTSGRPSHRAARS